jgi:hypothetical protein
MVAVGFWAVVGSWGGGGGVRMTHPNNASIDIDRARGHTAENKERKAREKPWPRLANLAPQKDQRTVRILVEPKERLRTEGTRRSIN